MALVWGAGGAGWYEVLLPSLTLDVLFYRERRDVSGDCGGREGAGGRGPGGARGEWPLQFSPPTPPFLREREKNAGRQDKRMGEP